MWALRTIMVVCMIIFFSFDLWHKDRIKIDVPSYYTYLPSVFIYGDLHLQYIDQNPGFFKDKIWYYEIENKQRLIKHPMGISVALTPFFLIGHLAAKISGSAQDGYSFCYQNAMSAGVLIYLFAGLFFLRKILLDFFSEKITAITLLSVFLGTNLLWYSTFEGLMPHAISFSLLCICMYSFFRWLRTGSKKYIFLFSILVGLCMLIRPLNLIILIYFVIFGILSKGGIRAFIDFLKPQYKNICTGAFFILSISFLQLLYWKFITGHWLYDVYINEHFIFKSPQIIPFLFSFRKGLFIYTPILIFSVLGLIVLYKTHRAVVYATLVTVAVTIYVLSSWWAWSYGICWGMRPMIDSYSLLSIPLAAGFNFIFSRGKIASAAISVLIVLLILLNLFQTWQYKNELIHFDDMSRESYFKGFFQTKTSNEWADCLKPYDWERRIKGLPQIEYSKEFFNAVSENEKVYLRGCNLLYVSVNPKAQNAVAAYTNGIHSSELFSVHHLTGDHVHIRSSSGYYLSVKNNMDNVLMADMSAPDASEVFEIIWEKEGDNKIFLKAPNGKYVSVMAEWPHVLTASAAKPSKQETFRFFVLEK